MMTNGLRVVDEAQAFASLSYAAVLGIAMLARAASYDNDYAHKQPISPVSLCT